MKKLVGLTILWLPIIAMAAESDGLNEGIDMVAQTGSLFGTIAIVVIASLWLLPIAFAGLVYTGQKKKAEQMHEDVGLKAAVLALLAGVLGAAMSYYVVGSVGKYAKAGSTPSLSVAGETLETGNKYILEAVIGSGVDKIITDTSAEDG